ncbi:MAG: hypothetical protein EOP10_31055 [Proteobacteria bacterium]|nr:MAG: hypothetical protein EOP10_31055 [Pseudomonadota bacterium]
MPEKAPHGIFELAASKTLGLTSSLFYAGCGLLLLAAILGAYFYWRHKNRALKKLAAPINPWDQLQALIQGSAAQASPTESMGLLNHSLRRGMELRFDKPYTALTSSELLAYLQKNSQFSSDFQAECAEFLKTADRVLFAFQPFEEGERLRWEKQISTWLESMRQGQAL